jgi:hypothetical protein
MTSECCKKASHSFNGSEIGLRATNRGVRGSTRAGWQYVLAGAKKDRLNKVLHVIEPGTAAAILTAKIWQDGSIDYSSKRTRS